VLTPQLFYGGYNSGRNYCYWPVSIHFRETSLLPIVIDDRSSQSRIRTHALLENLFRVIGSLD
jgi:hypothetical protein